MYQERSVVLILKETIGSWIHQLEKFVKTKKDSISLGIDILAMANNCDTISFNCPTLGQLKNHLENIVHIGYDLGLYALSLAMNALNNHLKTVQSLNKIKDNDGKILCEKIFQEMDVLIREKLTNLPEQKHILYSDKVMKVVECLRRPNREQCIIFVDRIYTAAFLCKILPKLLDKNVKMKYLAGSKLQIDEISLSITYQVVDHHRSFE